MFNTLKEKIAVSEEEMIMAVALEEQTKINRQAAKLKREAMAEIFKTKDADYFGVTIKKRDKSKKSFFMEE